MLEQLKTDLQNALNEMESKRQSGLDISSDEATVAILRHQIMEAEKEQENQKALEQEKAEKIGGLKETIRNIFEAVFPKDEMVKIVGLTEYESTQQTCNQLIDQAVDEDQEGVYAAFQQQLEQKDEKIRLLTVQGLESQMQLNIANEARTEYFNLNAELTEQVETQQYTIQALEQNNNDISEVVEQNNQEIQRLNQHVFDLQKQIANVQIVPQVIDIIPTLPSESLQERIAKAKVNSKLQLANVKSIGANWVEGINSEGNVEVAHVNDVEKVIEFPTIEPLYNPATEQEAPPQEANFQGDQVDANTDGENPADVRNGNLDEVLEENESEVVTRAEFNKRVGQLEVYVRQLNERAGLLPGEQAVA